MTQSFSELDAAAQRLIFYRLEKAPLPDEKAVRSAAAAAGLANLPDDFVDYCCRFGAGAFEKRAVLPLPAGCPLGDQFWVDILYAIGAKRDWDPVQLWQSTYSGRLPEGFLPIGTDPGGNLLLLSTESRAGIYVWDHEHRELAGGELDRRAAELRAQGIDAHQLDVDQVLLRWEQLFPGRVKNPSGHGNLYRVADAFAPMCAALREGNF